MTANKQNTKQLTPQPQPQIQTITTQHVMMITGQGTPTHTLTETLCAGRTTTFVNTQQTICTLFERPGILCLKYLNFNDVCLTITTHCTPVGLTDDVYHTT